MIPEFAPEGNLPPGVHLATWDQICDRFGTTIRRRRLLAGLRTALDSLQSAGRQRVYLDGSFVSSKIEPGDFDACWDEEGVDLDKLGPVLLVFDDRRAAQKAKFGGEFFPAGWPADERDRVFLNFFQIDKDTGAKNGIVALDSGGLQ